MNPDTFPEGIALQTKVVDWSWIAMVCSACVFQVTVVLEIFRCMRRHEAWKATVIQGAQVLLEKEEVIGGYGTFAKSEKVEQDCAEPPRGSNFGIWTTRLGQRHCYALLFLQWI